MPDRMIRDRARYSKQLDQLTDLAERLWWRLTTVADDYGRFRAEIPLLISSAFPLSADRRSSPQVAAAFRELEEATDDQGIPLVSSYHVNGHQYAYFPGWPNSQRVRAKHSKHPPPPDQEEIIPESRQQVTARHDRHSPQPAATGSQRPPSASESRESRVESREPRADKNRGTRGKKPRTTAPGDYSPTFEAWWTSYPRKLGKGLTWKLWKQVGAKRNPKTAQAIIDATEKHKKSHQWTKQRGEFIPKPSRFLEERRWEDDAQPDKGLLDGKSATDQWEPPEKRVEESNPEKALDDFGEL